MKSPPGAEGRAQGCRTVEMGSCPHRVTPNWERRKESWHTWRGLAPQRRHGKDKRIRIRQNRETDTDPWVSKVIVGRAGRIPPSPLKRELGRETGCILQGKDLEARSDEGRNLSMRHLIDFSGFSDQHQVPPVFLLGMNADTGAGAVYPQHWALDCLWTNMEMVKFLWVQRLGKCQGSWRSLQGSL